MCRDKEIRHYIYFIIVFIIFLWGASTYLYQSQSSATKLVLLAHDEAIATSLLEQGVSKEVIATALTNTKGDEKGSSFLAAIGITEYTEEKLLPFNIKFQQNLNYMVVFSNSVLSIILLGGTFFFLLKRNKMYRHAEGVVRMYIDGNYSRHLYQAEEGTIYQLFSAVDQLATMLQAKNETEQKTKEFLKGTISDISHQLKTPLAALSMYQEIIESEPHNINTVKEFSNKMGESIKRMEKLIHSMLKVTRLDMGSIVFEKNIYRISDLIERSISELTTRAQSEKKRIILDGKEDELLTCDIEWTSEAIENIVKNALDYTDSNGIIHISWKHSPTMVRIFIADNGKGISQEDIHHIFKRFYRSKNFLNKQGIGLGLSLAKSIVEGQGGLISVQSNLNNGTTFILSFMTEL